MSRLRQIRRLNRLNISSIGIGAVCSLVSADLVQSLFSGGGIRQGQVVDTSGTRGGSDFNVDFNDDFGSENILSPAQPGRCYNFDGTNDYVDIPNIVFSGEFDITVDYYQTSTSSQKIIYGDAGIANIKLAYGVSPNKFFIRIISGGSGDQTVDTPAVNQWHTVRLTRDSSNKVDLYVNNGSANRLFGDVAQSGDFDIHELGTSQSTRFDGRMSRFQAYSSIKTQEEIDSFDTTDLVRLYKCDEGAGTIAYDSSGNSNHGTITNATLSTFHATDIGVRYSRQNEVGYSDGAGLLDGVLIPRNEANPAQDVLGGSLQYTDRVRYNAELVESNCATFDGTNDYVILNSTPYTEITADQDFTMAFWYRTTDTSGIRRVLNNYFPNATRMGVMTRSNEIRTGYYNGSTYSQAASCAYTSTDWNHIAVTHTNAGVFKIYINGVSQTLGSNTPTLGGSLPPGSGFSIGHPNTATMSGGLCNVVCFSEVLSDSQVVQIYGGSFSGFSTIFGARPLSEGEGTTIYDVSGNGNHGTTYNITESSFRGSTQDNFHWNITEGFRLSGSTRIPALVDGSNAADGNSITNPAGDRHNNAETKLKMPVASPAMILADATDNFWFTAAGVANSVSYSDIVANVGSNNIIFADVTTENEKKTLVTYSSARTSSTDPTLACVTSKTT